MGTTFRWVAAIAALAMGGCGGSDEPLLASPEPINGRGSVSVLVRDVDGATVAHATVSLLVDCDSATMRLQAQTDAHGTAHFTSRAPARVRAYASNGASAGSTQEVALPAEGRIVLEITVRPAADYSMLGVHTRGRA